MARLSLAFLAALVFALAVGLNSVLARTFLTHAVHKMTGSQMNAESVEFAGSLHRFTATNFELRAPSGATLLRAPRAEFDLSQESPRIVLDHPEAVVPRDEAAGAASLLARLREGGASLRVNGGTLRIANALDFQGIDATLDASKDRLAYDVSAELIDDGKSYPIHGHAGPGDLGVAHDWSAQLLPLGPFVDAAAPEELDARGTSGTLADVALTADEIDGKPTQINASAQLSGGTLELGDPSHTLAGLHGKLVFDGEAGGSRLLSGTLDGEPIELAGLLEHYDVARFARLLLQIAAEPNLREVRMEATAPGIAFAKYRLESPNGRLAIFVSSIDTKNPTVSLNAVLAGDHVTSGGERTSTMGQRTGAVLGIDGDYFDIGGSYAPQGILVISGKLLRSPTKRYAMTVHRGNHVTFDEYTFAGTARVGERTISIHDFNVYPPGKVGIVTADFGKLTPHPGTTFVALSPMDGTKENENGTYRVTSVGPIKESQPARFGLAFGRWASSKPPRVGETVDVHYALDPSYDDIVTAEGGGPLMIRDGKWIEDPDAPAPGEHDVRWPVVGVGRLADDTLFFFEVDGRWPDISVGMTRPEFGDLMLRYHVVDGFAFDSGGSADIIAREPGEKEASLRSHPSDQSWERYVTDAMFVYSSAPNIDP